ncbi:MAG: TPM domain-containing protein [Ruminiclostridium sp.]|nr:TPM domain-containing protein [Ruminiclostridium sp.]
MKKFVLLIVCLLFSFLNAVPAFAEPSGCYRESISDDTAVLYDLDGSLSEAEEKELFPVITELVREMGFSVCVVISDNVGESKTDAQVIDYADLLLESFCGIDGDGILLLINNDTQYDWISTSGCCIDIFSDWDIERIFDYFYDDLKDGNYYNAVYYFSKAVKRYSESDSVSASFGDLLGLVALSAPWLLLFPVIFTIAFVYNIKRRYELRPQKGAGNYLVTDSIQYSEAKKDTFIRSYVRVESNSSGSRSHSSSGHHSSTHRSSSGGRHGGGGRRR